MEQKTLVENFIFRAVKMVNSWELLTIFAKSFVWQCS